MTYIEVMQIYQGSNGDATKALYQHLESVGPIGIIAVNLFRACKCSERAKVYRGGSRGRGSYRRMAYDRKEWSLKNLSEVLTKHGAGLRWGWKIDPVMNPDDPHRNVLYVEIPSGQVSFHSPSRFEGPQYPGEWDGRAGLGPDRICRWIGQLLSDARQAA